jgi:hypothetical protein
MPDLLNDPIDHSDRFWQIYRLEGVSEATARINTAATEARALLRGRIAGGATVPVAVEAAYEHLYAALKRDRAFGATDTEPDGVAQSLIRDWASAITGLPITGENCPALWRLG